MDKNDSIDEFGLCSSSESVPKTLDKPVTWYGHRVMQTVLVILLLCYCTWRHKWLSLKKSWSWHIKVWENQYSETLFLYICWVEFILSIMFAFLLPCPTTPGSIPRRGALQNTPGSHVTHPTARKNLLWDWDSGTVGQRRHRRCWIVVLYWKKKHILTWEMLVGCVWHSKMVSNRNPESPKMSENFPNCQPLMWRTWFPKLVL